MVLEQRIGRIHRIGTINTVIVHTILLQGSREADIYLRLIARLDRIVGALAQDPETRTQYFRRILGGIPLESLRELFSGQRPGDDAIAAAVEAGKQAVEQVDAELQRHRVQLTVEERGRATMPKLVHLLEASDKIKQINRAVTYTRIRFDEARQEFEAREVSCPCYRIKHGDGNAGIDWVVFDREAAAKSHEVTRDRTGGINHPLIGLALASLKTPLKTPAESDEFHHLTIGVGTYDRESLQVLAGGKVEPVIVLTYLTAYLDGEHFFNQRLRVFTVSASQPTPSDITNDGQLVEEIYWSQLENDHSSLAIPSLASDFVERIATEDRSLRKQLETELRNESGDWIGAVWPLAVTILLQK